MGWSDLPELALCRILRYLPFRDRCVASTVCSTWRYCFGSPEVWETTVFTFKHTIDGKLLTYINKYGHLMKHLSIQVDQIIKNNRDNACAAIQSLVRMKLRRLQSFSFVLNGENPTFYAGTEFVQCFKELFTVGDCPQFLSIDLGGILFTIGDDLLDAISENNPCIERLNLQSQALICKISPSGLKRAVQRCRHLRDLSVIACSLTDEVLRLFLEEDRKPIEHLSLMARSEQRLAPPISSQTWAAMKTVFPALRVSLGFDSTCPMEVVEEILKPEVPVRCLRLEVYAPVEESMFYIPVYYKDTIETLIVHPAMPSKRFNIALESTTKRCLKLKTLLIYCVIPEDLIQRILENCPEIRKRGTYILKSVAEPEDQWVMEKDSPNWAGNAL